MSAVKQRINSAPVLESFGAHVLALGGTPEPHWVTNHAVQPGSRCTKATGEAGSWTSAGPVFTSFGSAATEFVIVVTGTRLVASAEESRVTDRLPSTGVDSTDPSPARGHGLAFLGKGEPAVALLVWPASPGSSPRGRDEMCDRARRPTLPGL